MTLAQTRALSPLLTQIGEFKKLFRGDLDTAANQHLRPHLALDWEQWQRILEEFGTP